MSDHSSGDGHFNKSHHRRLSKNQYNPQSNAASMVLDDYPPSPDMLQRKDIESLNFLSAPHKVFQILSGFDARKRAIVESIGFGGILKLPFITTENKAFSYWLLFHMRWYNACIAVGDNIRLTLTEEHIGKITGLNSSGHDISDRRLKSVDDRVAFMASRIPFLGSHIGVLEQAELFVQKDLPAVLSKESVDNFKAAFVIFIIGRFLAPSSEHPDGNANFWGALQNTDEISSFNWCSYVLGNLKAGARSVNSPKSDNKPLSTVIGCPLILQIFYLDNIDFGELNLKHDLLPRWRAYSDEYINAMVAADSISITTPWTPPLFGKHEVTRMEGICYIFNRQPTRHTPSGSTPSPRVRPLRPRRSSLEHSSSPDISDEDISRQVAIDCAGSDSRSPFKIFDTSSADFDAMIRRNLPSQLDSKIFEELKKYNTNCSNIISTSHRALASSIANENAQFATRLIEYFNNLPNTNNCLTPYTNLPPRRRKPNDLSGATDSSTDGEDNILLSKKPRISYPYLHIPGGSNAGTIQHNAITDPGSFYNKGGPSRPSTDDVVSPLDSKLQTLPIPMHPMLPLEHRHGNHKESTTSHPSPQFNHSEFVTPLATLKMNPARGVSPNADVNRFSPSFFPALRLDEENGFDLNSGIIEDACHFTSATKKNAVIGPSCESHFCLNLEHVPAQTNAMKDFYRWISNTNSKELDSTWIISNFPRGLNISGQQLKEQFVLNKTMNFEVFDASIRRFKELDSVIYQPVAPLRWRHLLESDYARNVLDSSQPAEKKPIVDQFVGNYVDYEVSRCRMFFVPVFANGVWCCYSWDLDSSVVYIIDPTASTPKDEVIINKHMHTIQQLSESLSSSVSDLFSGWFPNFPHSKVAVLRISGMPYSSKVSGLMTLFSIWNFDDKIVSSTANLENIANFKAFLLSQILALGDNKGRLPTSFIVNLA